MAEKLGIRLITGFHAMTVLNFKHDDARCVLRAVALIALILAVSAIGADSPPVPPSAPNASTPASDKPVPEPADNSFCYVCHRNFEKEPLNAKHTKIGVGCEKCHGSSERHSADEDGITPPEIMYSKLRINPYCVKCHTAEKLEKTDEHQLALTLMKEGGKANAIADKASEAKAEAAPVKWICTDCHGQHRMKVRTRVWDKETGKLIKDDGVRMMDKSRPANQ
jgi:hypothetical protein